MSEPDESQMNLALCEKQGWKWVPHPTTHIGGYWEIGERGGKNYRRGDWGSREREVGLPNFFANDCAGLWACHEMEKTHIIGKHGAVYRNHLTKPARDFDEANGNCLTEDAYVDCCTHATATERARALYLTLCTGELSIHDPAS